MIMRLLAAGALTAGMLVSAPVVAANASTQSTYVDGWAVNITASKGFTCRNSLARMLHRVGFRGHNNRMAYAIVMRESKGQNLNESSRWYTGALGIWQVQTSAHRNKSWWSRSAMLNPQRQSRLMFLHLTNRGRDWRHWGLTQRGTLDTTFYKRWSSWQHENWIMRPFRTHYAAYPCK